jgi:hypothetical protein
VSAVPPGFRPKGAGTGLGPLPGGADPLAAVDACPELPFWATVESRATLWGGGLPGVELDGDRPVWVGRSKAPGQTGLTAPATAVLEGFLEALAGRPPGWLLLPAPGPVSLAFSMDAGGKPALNVPSARGPFGLGYAARLRSVVTRVREALPAWKLVLLLDEPELGQAPPKLARELWSGLGATGAEITGIGLGAAPPWPLVLDLNPQLIAFDAAAGGDDATDDPAFRRVAESGTAIAWGLAGPGDSDPAALASRLVDLVTWTAGDYLPEVMARSLVTPAGDLGRLTPGEADARLRLAAAVAAPARDLAGLP